MLRNVLGVMKRRLGEIGAIYEDLQALSARQEAAARRSEQEFAELRRCVDESKVLTARMLLAERRARGPVDKLCDAEFKVFSQFGDDGIIQYLVDAVKPEHQRFVEFGVGDYLESNTRFLLTNDNWQGLVMEGDEGQVERIRHLELCWRHDLTVVHAFVDRDNINDLLRQHGFDGPLGLLHIDIDGNDYWVWEAIYVCDPTIVIVEYNSVFGAERPVTVPYNPKFVRSTAHHSRLYYGASLPALCHLAQSKGFAFIGSNSAGNNAYFVKRACLGSLKELTPNDGFVESRFSESRDEQGKMTLVRGAQRQALIAELPMVDVTSGEVLSLHDALN